MINNQQYKIMVRINNYQIQQTQRKHHLINNQINNNIIVIFITNTMKPNSPPHRMIQLRRKTQKIVIPKASWDLSNKQNSNNTNLYDTNKSKNSSSKKSSAEKSVYMKKNMSMNQNILKCNFKKSVKNQTIIKHTKERSMEKKSNRKKLEQKVQSSIPSSNCFYQSMTNIFKKAKNKQGSANFKLQYQKIFNKFTTKNESEKQLFNTLSKHIQLWVNKYQILYQNTHNYNLNKQTQKLDNQIGKTYQEQQNIVRHSTNQIQSQSYCSQPSVCSYIVDPQQEIKMKPIRKELKQKLHLNFSKIQLIRKKQLE